MKKLLSLTLAAIMLLSMSTVSFAANITTNSGTGSTVVTYGVEQGFAVTIPGDFTIDQVTNKATAEVSASNVLIPHGKKLNVAVSGHDYVDSWELIDQAEATNSLTYTIGTTEGAADIGNNGVVLSVPAATAAGEATMYFTVIDTLTKAGTYTDTLTFTVGVVDADGDSTLYATNFADNSWSDIITAVQNDEVPSTWAVGDIKPMTINGTEYDVQIIGKNHDTYTSGGTAPLTFQLVEIYTKTSMDSNAQGSNSVGWSGSEMRTTTLSTILSTMPIEVQSAIKAVDKETLKGDKSGLETTSDKLFLLSEIEVFNTTDNSDGNAEGRQYAFYANGGSAVKNFEGNADYWWLRGPHCTIPIAFSGVDSDGILYHPIVNKSYGVSFGFCF